MASRCARLRAGQSRPRLLMVAQSLLLIQADLLYRVWLVGRARSRLKPRTQKQRKHKELWSPKDQSSLCLCSILGDRFTGNAAAVGRPKVLYGPARSATQRSGGMQRPVWVT